MRAWTYLRDRKLMLGIVLLALAGALSQLLLWWLVPPPGNSDFIGPPRSSYTLVNFRLASYNALGQPTLYVAAPRLVRREGDNSLYINAPIFDLPSRKAGVPDWLGHSEYGWVNASGDLMKLQGPVFMHRAAYGDTGKATLHSSDVTLWPKENRVATAASAQMVQGALTMSGVGLRANLDDKHLELLDDSHGSFPPRRR